MESLLIAPSVAEDVRHLVAGENQYYRSPPLETLAGPGRCKIAFTKTVMQLLFFEPWLSWSLIIGASTLHVGLLLFALENQPHLEPRYNGKF